MVDRDEVGRLEEIRMTDPKKEFEQPPLIEVEEWWQEEWQGMPEFVQGNLKPLKTIYVHFEDEEDMKAFSRLIGQKITVHTQYIWYPEHRKEKSRYVYVDES